MAVLDLAAGWQQSRLVRAAQERGCTVVVPRDLFLHQLARQGKRIIGKDVPRVVLAEAVRNVLVEEE
jgi:shikimate 5-dehydrogenase